MLLSPSDISLAHREMVAVREFVGLLSLVLRGDALPPATPGGRGDKAVPLPGGRDRGSLF